MHFDDRLATVLRQPATGEVIARIQYRQLLDLLGTTPAGAEGEQVDDAFLRLSQIAASVAAPARAAMLGEQALRLRNPRLVAQLATAEPAPAAAAIDAADLTAEQWLDLIPALPGPARGFLRQRGNLAPDVAALLTQLGVHDRGLPPAESITSEEPTPVPTPAAAAPAPPPSAPVSQLRPAAIPATPANDAEAEPAVAVLPPPPPLEHGDGIGAIVRRIEAFRRTRHDTASGDAPHLPLAELHPAPQRTFDFATDTEGRIVWADPVMAPMAVGLRLAARDSEAPLRAGPGLVAAMRRRQPIDREQVTIEGAPSIAGNWQIDATPRFEPLGGRFTGYLGRMRRPAVTALATDAASPAPDAEADRMRQILHELRTPVNAIQGFAEVIQQQLFGPTPHEYRALAATVVGDAARMLAGFEELERLARLDSGTLPLDAGACDLGEVLGATVAQLKAFSQPRRSGFTVDIDPEPATAGLPVAIAQSEAERLIWRLLATLAGAAAPGEMLKLRARQRDGAARVSVRLPALLALREDEALFHAGGSQPQALSVGMFGVGFALRLARAEARAAGGALQRRGDRLRLTLPSQQSEASEIEADASAIDQPKPAGLDHAAP